MSESNRRSSRAKKRQAKILNHTDWSWKIWATCEVCGSSFCVNCAWEDRKPRTPKLKGYIICAGCDPRELEGLGWRRDTMRTDPRGRLKYRNFMALILVRAIAKRACERETDCGKCLPCAARKLERIK